MKRHNCHNSTLPAAHVEPLRAAYQRHLQPTLSSKNLFARAHYRLPTQTNKTPGNPARKKFPRTAIATILSSLRPIFVLSTLPFYSSFLSQPIEQRLLRRHRRTEDCAISFRC
jgi:hypothetical protein